MKKYSKEPTSKPPEPELPNSGTPKTIRQVQYQLDELKDKVMDVLSSPSQHKFESFVRGACTILDQGDYVKFELSTTYKRLQEIIIKKPTNRKRIQKGGELTAEWAQSVIKEREYKAAEKEANKEARMLRIIANKEKKEQKAAWVAWRAKERTRKKAIKEFQGVLGAPELYKEHTPPAFPEPRKEPNKPTTQENEYISPYTPTLSQELVIWGDIIYGEEQKGKEKEEEEESDGESEENFITLNIDRDIGYASDSGDSINSKVSSLRSSLSDEEGYFVL
ncbi:hypothetical protein B7463_g3828, partial [Scytalidium lignicola]